MTPARRHSGDLTAQNANARSKYSSNAPYTPNQHTTIPAINDSADGLSATVVGNVPEHGPDLGDTIVISDVVTMVMHP